MGWEIVSIGRGEDAIGLNAHTPVTFGREIPPGLKSTRLEPDFAHSQSSALEGKPLPHTLPLDFSLSLSPQLVFFLLQCT